MAAPGLIPILSLEPTIVRQVGDHEERLPSHAARRWPLGERGHIPYQDKAGLLVRDSERIDGPRRLDWVVDHAHQAPFRGPGTESHVGKLSWSIVLDRVISMV